MWKYSLEDELDFIEPTPLLEFFSGTYAIPIYFIIGGLTMLAVAHLIRLSAKSRLSTISFIAIGLAFGAVAIPDSSMWLERNQNRHAQTVWQDGIHPSYTPPGYLLYDPHSGCMPEAQKTAINYKCEFIVKEFSQAYLTDETYSLLTTQLKRPGQAPRITFHIIRDNDDLSQYKINDESLCSVEGIILRGASPPSDHKLAKQDTSDHAYKSVPCAQEQTTAGITVTRQLPRKENEILWYGDTNEPATKIAQTNGYYFEKDNLVVAIEIERITDIIFEDYLDALWINDPNFKKELYTIIDSFQ